MKVRTNKVFTFNGYKYQHGAEVDIDQHTAERLMSIGYVSALEEPKAEPKLDETFSKDAKKVVVKRADPVTLEKK